jgi:hypothetical protein
VIARARRLYAIERPDGRYDVHEATVDVPESTAALRSVGRFLAEDLGGLEQVVTHTAGVYLLVEVGDKGVEVERIAAAALHAVRPEAPAGPVEPRPSPDPVGVLAEAHVAELREQVARLSATVALLPASRRRAAARAAVGEIDRAATRALRALGIDDPHA